METVTKEHLPTREERLVLIDWHQAEIARLFSRTRPGTHIIDNDDYTPAKMFAEDPHRWGDLHHKAIGHLNSIQKHMEGLVDYGAPLEDADRG